MERPVLQLAGYPVHIHGQSLNSASLCRCQSAGGNLVPMPVGSSRGGTATSTGCSCTRSCRPGPPLTQIVLGSAAKCKSHHNMQQPSAQHQSHQSPPHPSMPHGNEATAVGGPGRHLPACRGQAAQLSQQSAGHSSPGGKALLEASRPQGPATETATSAAPSPRPCRAPRTAGHNCRTLAHTGLASGRLGGSNDPRQ